MPRITILRRFGHVVVPVWIAAQLFLLVRGLLPAEVTGGGWLPWSMFRAVGPGGERVVEASGTDHTGREIEVPLRDLYRYTRGSTELRVFDDARALKRGGTTAERAAFARWLFEQMEERGTSLRSVEVRSRVGTRTTVLVRHEL